jgi:hypothetical protein
MCLHILSEYRRKECGEATRYPFHPSLAPVNEKHRQNEFTQFAEHHRKERSDACQSGKGRSPPSFPKNQELTKYRFCGILYFMNWQHGKANENPVCLEVGGAPMFDLEAPKQITAFTYASRGYKESMNTPHRQVVGIRLHDSQPIELWDPRFPHGSSNEHFRTRGGTILQENLTVTARMLCGLKICFEEFEARGRELFYNCFSFAENLNGNHDEYFRDAAEDVVVRGKIVNPMRLRLGNVGVIGFRTSNKAEPLHSVVGLGEDVDECLQITCWHGYVAISSYQAAWDANVTEKHLSNDVRHTLGFYRADD